MYPLWSKNFYFFFFSVWEMKAFSYMPVVTQKVCGRGLLQDMVSDSPELLLWWTSISLLWLFLWEKAKCKLTMPTICHLLWEPLPTEKKTKPQILPQNSPPKDPFPEENHLAMLKVGVFCKQWWRNYRFWSQKNSSSSQISFLPAPYFWCTFLQTCVET